jgi:serine/threonine-protein kinase RsbW
MVDTTSRVPSPLARDRRTFRNDVAELRRMSEWFREFSMRGAIPESSSLDMELCLNELLENSIRHAFGGGEHEIAIELARDGDWLRARLEDDGRPFDPLSAPPRNESENLETMQIGGWGIPIVRALAHDVHYDRRGDRNVVSVDIRIPPPASGARQDEST